MMPRWSSGRARRRRPTSSPTQGAPIDARAHASPPGFLTTVALAHTSSSWSEANPGGGRDGVQRYLDRSKSEVRQAEQLLKQILTSLPVEL